MDALQFSLFFVALLIGYVLVHLRLVRFEEHLQKLAGIRGLDDRLRALDDRLRQLADAFEKVHIDRIEGQLDRLHEDLEDVRDATTLVRQAVVQIPSPQAAPAPAAPHGVPALPVDPPHGRITALIETRLLQMGYHNLRLLGDLAELRGDDVEVQVECERGGMPCKGRVVVRNGSLHDVALQPVTQMFP